MKQQCYLERPARDRWDEAIANVVQERNLYILPGRRKDFVAETNRIRKLLGPLNPFEILRAAEIFIDQLVRDIKKARGGK